MPATARAMPVQIFCIAFICLQTFVFGKFFARLLAIANKKYYYCQNLLRLIINLKIF